jgi:hypothetical protein
MEPVPSGTWKNLSRDLAPRWEQYGPCHQSGLHAFAFSLPEHLPLFHPTARSSDLKLLKLAVQSAAKLFSSWRRLSFGILYRSEVLTPYIIALWKVGKFLREYTAQYPRRQSSSYSPPWEPEISHFQFFIPFCFYKSASIDRIVISVRLSARKKNWRAFTKFCVGGRFSRN